MLTAGAVPDGVRNITADELDRATALHKAMRSETDPGDWLDLNRQFHHVLDGASRRPLYQEMLGRLADLSALYVGVTISSSKSRRANANRDHAKMLEAYRMGDADTAVELALAHLNETVSIARERLLSTDA